MTYVTYRTDNIQGFEFRYFNSVLEPKSLALAREAVDSFFDIEKAFAKLTER